MKAINYKQLGEQFKTQSEKAKKLSLATATATFLALSASSCDWQPRTGSVFDTAKGDYQDGTTEKLIQSEKAELAMLIDAYNEYFDRYESYQSDALDLQARGDLGGYDNVFNKMKALEKTIRKTEKKIDKKGDKLLDLTKYFHKGKQKAAGAQAKQDDQADEQTLSRRTFTEYAKD